MIIEKKKIIVQIEMIWSKDKAKNTGDGEARESGV